MTDERISFIQYYEKLPVAVFICDGNDELVEYNSAAATLFNIAPATGRKDWYPSFEVYDQDDRLIDAVYKPITSSIKVNPNGHRQEVRFRLPDGTDRLILVSSIAKWDDHGDYNGAIHTLSDITALRDSERQQSLLAAIVDSSQDAIITKNLDGRITSWNPAAEKMFGFTALEAIGSSIDLIIPRQRLAEEKRIINAVSKGKKVEHFETVRLTKAGAEIPISLTISPVINVRGKIIGASKIARDITKNKLKMNCVIIHPTWKKWSLCVPVS